MDGLGPRISRNSGSKTWKKGGDAEAGLKPSDCLNRSDEVMWKVSRTADAGSTNYESVRMSTEGIGSA
jgi:hypothetical protein